MSSSNQIVRAEIEEIGFSLYTDVEIRALSVCKITSPVATDALGNVVQGGLEDPKLGLVDSKSGSCVTCGMNYFNCPGHMGNIDLCVPVSLSCLFVLFSTYVCMYVRVFKVKKMKVKRRTELKGREGNYVVDEDSPNLTIFRLNIKVLMSSSPNILMTTNS